MREANPYYRELLESKDKDKEFRERFLGNWDVRPQPLSDQRLLELSSGVRKAEFVTIEETLSMAAELLERRRAARVEDGATNRREL